MKKLENKTVFITGGLSGIGKACAIAAAKEGANIAVVDLKSDAVPAAGFRGFYFCESPISIKKSSGFGEPDYRITFIQPMQELIIPLLKSQDKAAVELLYDQYAGSLYGIVLRIVYTKELAEQVMQDTFVKAWRNGASYDENKGRLFTWLLNIARNTAIDATRTSHFKHSRQTDGIETLIYTKGGDSINSDALGLKEAVNKMDEKYSLLINLVYFNQYTQREVAEEMGVPLGTIKTRMRRAITVLKKSFV